MVNDEMLWESAVPQNPQLAEIILVVGYPAAWG